jgi:aspartate carbamoyltransferase
MRRLYQQPDWREAYMVNRVTNLVFFEPSSRTRGSFEYAAKALGGEAIASDVGSSSVKKGEDMLDSVATFATQSDILIIRSDITGMPTEAAQHIQELHERGQLSRAVPVINAGDGYHEHPTQALLDMSWMDRHFRGTDGLTLTVVGDLERYRAHHSLILAAARRGIRTINLVGMEGVDLPDFVLDDPYVRDNVTLQRSSDLDDFLGDTDVIYMGRRPKEYCGDSQEEDRRAARLIQSYEQWRITPERMHRASDRTVVMHPLPRGQEIDRSFDADPRAGYISQMENGIPARMALLGLVSGVFKVRGRRLMHVRRGEEHPIWAAL